ncbi:unnamed protein product [Orchesella dallaii]|uniref:CHK kinase-like domain-containing protein n=1 Tax=Orchesella dallaii TaxID=48710 RepID=A0ABP1PHX3_9HEXA
MANRKEGLDWEHCSLFITTLAKFHAISFAMFGGDFDKIVKKYPWLVENMWMEEKVPEPLKQFFQGSFMQHANNLKEMGEEEAGSLVGKICNENFLTQLYSLCGDKVPMAVIGHGDCWTNNLMFRYDPETNKPIDIKFVDFQQSRTCSRLVDIHYFLYTSPQMSILNERESDILTLYFDEFTKFSKKLGVNVEGTQRELLSRENFDKEVEKFRYFGVVAGIMMATIVSADSGDVPDMENMKEEDFTGADGGNEAMASFMASMMKGKVMGKIKNIVKNHLPKCAEVKQF